MKDICGKVSHFHGTLPTVFGKLVREFIENKKTIGKLAFVIIVCCFVHGRFSA